METRHCPVCGEIIKGRSDKKFCGAKCKSSSQYEKRQTQEVYFFKVDKQLKVNRKILKRFNRSGYTTIRQAELKREGFNPRFHTHYWKNSKGEIYFFVYEYGFLAKTINGVPKFVLITWQPFMDKG